MSDRELLSEASELLRRASEAVDDEDTRDRLYEQSNQIATLAARDRGPDHGRLDRHMNTLGTLADELDGATSQQVADARELLREYRTGVEGV